MSVDALNEWLHEGNLRMNWFMMIELTRPKRGLDWSNIFPRMNKKMRDFMDFMDLPFIPDEQNWEIQLNYWFNEL